MSDFSYDSIFVIVLLLIQYNIVRIISMPLFFYLLLNMVFGVNGVYSM